MTAVLPLTRAAAPAPADLLALAKPRIVALVAITAAAGFALGLCALPPGQYPATSLGATLWVLLHTALGTALAAGGTSALNQLLERDVDALMRRTARRPLPTGRVTPRQAAAFAWTVGALGVVELLAFVNATTALLAATTLVVYVFAYTPLKRRTHLATLVGAVPGALPIVGGWTAAGAPLDVRAAALFGIMFLWQIPHFLALGWIYREDYARAGIRLLSSDDDSGRATFRQAALNAAALIPVTLAPPIVAMAGGGPVYALVALVLSAVLVALSVAALRAPTPRRARRLFLATLAYLPVLLGVLVARTL